MIFTPNQIYKRSEIHKEYGGNPQSGISSSAKAPYIFIFSGKGGEQHGYRDQWENENVFSYTGEGQVGDMQFTRGNLALLDHLKNGKRVFLFQYVKKAYVRFVSELEFYHYGYFETHDRLGQLRKGIKFFFKKAGVEMYLSPEELVATTTLADTPTLFDIIEPNITERQGLVTSRVGQGAFRMSLLHRWEYQCAVTGFKNPKVLIASHIVPWKDATDQQRLDVDNGILLSPTYDALFDRHMISFENNGKIILSQNLQKYDYGKIGVSGKERISTLSSGNIDYLDNHRSAIR
jgi:hypothetical protein